MDAARARRLRRAVAPFGPAFVASVAYVDPGNFATNFAGGAERGYQLAWVIVLADVAAILVQYVSSKVGIATGCTLPELCRARFGQRVNVFLWVQAEVVAMATDLAEFVGAAVGLHLVLGVPLFPSALITAVVAFLILGLDRQRYRRFELSVIALLGVLTGGMVYLLFAVGHQDAGALAAGVLPRLDGRDALPLTVGIIGATVMPHVVYLHSALQVDRMPSEDAQERRRLLRFSRWDCLVGLGLAGVVNLLMLCLAAALFAPTVSGRAIGFAEVHADLAATVGGGAALALGIALMASGLSAASVGTYAGQVVMSGFLGWRTSVFLRRLVTMLPSLVVVGLTDDPIRVLVYSQVVLSFGIPFALVPLVLVSRDPTVMGEMTNSLATTLSLVVITAVISIVNVYLLVSLAAGG